MTGPLFQLCRGQKKPDTTFVVTKLGSQVTHGIHRGIYQPHKAQTFGLYRILLLDMTVRFNGKNQRRPFLKADFTCPPNRVRAGADQYSCKSSNTYPSINCNVFQHVSAMSKLGLLWKGCHQRNLSKHQVLQSNMQDIVRLSSLCCAKMCKEPRGSDCRPR